MLFRDYFIRHLHYFISKDRTAPSLTCPDDIRVPAESYQTYAWVWWDHPIAQDRGRQVPYVLSTFILSPKLCGFSYLGTENYEWLEALSLKVNRKHF